MNIYLIGYRCTGKTSVSTEIGRRLGWPVLDADMELVQEQGRSIADIVAADGWSTFRAMEKTVLKRISAMERRVVATGGGVILDPENVAEMKKSGIIVLLKARPDTIYQRLTGDRNTGQFRPALTNQSQYDEIVSTLSTRQPLYEAAMDFCVETDTLTIAEVCDRIMDGIKEKMKVTKVKSELK